MSKKTKSISHLDRREFLVLSSVALAGVATSSFGAELGSTNVPPLLSIGHWRGNTRDAQLFASSGDLKVVSAASIPTGDPKFLQSGVSLRVEGFYRASSRAAISLALTVRYRLSRENDDTTPVIAWSHVDGGSVASASAPANIYAPIEADDGLQLALLRSSVTSRRRRPVAAAPVDPNASADALVRAANDLESRFKLSVNAEEGMPKLSMGTYFIALRRDASQKEPDWSTVRVANALRGEYAAKAFLYRTDALGDQPVDFDYLAITCRQGNGAA